MSHVSQKEGMNHHFGGLDNVYISGYAETWLWVVFSWLIIHISNNKDSLIVAGQLQNLKEQIGC